MKSDLGLVHKGRGTSSLSFQSPLFPWQSHNFWLCHSRWTSSRLGSRHSLLSSESAAHRCYWGVVLICIFQRTNERKQLYVCLLATCIPSSMKCVFKPFLFFPYWFVGLYKSACVFKQYSGYEFFISHIFLVLLLCGLCFPLKVSLGEEKFLF